MGHLGRPRVHRGDIQCPECGSNWCKKFGKSNGKQRYKCNQCGRIFYQDVKYHKYPMKTRLLALEMYKNGKTITEISKDLNIPSGTVARWIYEGD